MAEVPVVTTEEPVAEETLPGTELLRAQELAADLTTTDVEIQIPTWNLGERIPIAPQIWDADTLQIVEGTADEEVDIVTLDEAVLEPPKKSPKEKRRKKWKRSAHQHPPRWPTGQSVAESRSRRHSGDRKGRRMTGHHGRNFGPSKCT
jgi:hypothetical protein